MKRKEKPFNLQVSGTVRALLRIRKQAILAILRQSGGPSGRSGAWAEAAAHVVVIVCAHAHVRVHV